MKKLKTTFEREMAKEGFRISFEKQYKQLVFSELLIAFMSKNKLSVRLLAKQVGISPSVIQEVRSGRHTNLTLNNLQKIIGVFGAELNIKIGKETIPLKLIA